jgi:hypothetical protein
VKQAAADAGGFWIPAFGMQPPGIGGSGLERIDVVLTAHGLADFESEYAQAPECLIDDVPVRVLPPRPNYREQAFDEPTEIRRCAARASGHCPSAG